MNPTSRLLPFALLAAACARALAQGPATNEIDADALIPVAPPPARAEEPVARATRAGAGAAMAESFPPSPIAPGTVIIAVGGSTTFGLDSSYLTHSTYLEQFCRLPGIQGRVGTVDNQGISGGGLGSAFDHYTNAWTDPNKVPHRAVQSFAPRRTGVPAWIFLWIGSNDFAQPGFDLPAYLVKYKAYVAQAHADGFKVAVATVNSRGDNYNPLAIPDSFFQRNPQRLALNRALSRMDPFYDGAACPDAIVRLDEVLNDVQDAGGDPAERGLFGPGFTHPRQLGYYWVALAWYQALVLNGSPHTPNVATTSQANNFRLPQTFQPVELDCASGAGWYRVATFDNRLPRAQTPKHFHIAAYGADPTSRNNFELIVAGCDGNTGTLCAGLTILNAKTAGAAAPLASRVRVGTAAEGVAVDLYLAQSGRVALTQDSDATVASFAQFNPGPLNNPALLNVPRTGFASNAGIAGTPDGGNAAPGDLGEYLAATTPADHAVPLAAGTVASVAHLDLPAGDWDVTGVVDFHGEGGTTVTFLQAGSSANPATLGSQDATAGVPATGPLPIDAAQPIPTVRYALNAPATITLVAKAGFTGPLAAYGTLRARRMR